jgi:hypothetical protein
MPQEKGQSPCRVGLVQGKTICVDNFHFEGEAIRPDVSRRTYAVPN